MRTYQNRSRASDVPLPVVVGKVLRALTRPHPSSYMPCLLDSKLLLGFVNRHRIHASSLSLTPNNGTQPVDLDWVDPTSLLHYHHESPIKGNTPDYMKQLNYNTFMSYGVGEDGFGYKVGKTVRFGEVNITRNKKVERQKLYQSPRM